MTWVEGGEGPGGSSRGLRRPVMCSRVDTATPDADRSQIWMRVDGPNQRVLAFDNMDSRSVGQASPFWCRILTIISVRRDS